MRLASGLTSWRGGEEHEFEQFVVGQCVFAGLAQPLAQAIAVTDIMRDVRGRRISEAALAHQVL